VALEAITKPFNDDNEVELEAELNLVWLESEQTDGWLSSHFDIVDKFSPAERPEDARAYTHKLNFELDTAVAVFNRLPETNWFHGVEIEGSLDYVATGLPKEASRWSFSLVFVLPIAWGRHQVAYGVTKTRSFFGLTYRRSPIFGFSASY